jgi:PAS domain S-box-containing protein
MHVSPDDDYRFITQEQRAGSAEQVVEQALTGGAPQRVGWFRFYFDDERWEWSPQVEKMHGYLPGSITPTTELVLSHKHPDDFQHVAATLDDIRRTHQAFSTRHRILDVEGHVRHVVVVGAQLYDDGGTVIGTHGFYVDVTPSEQAREDRVTAAVAEVVENRSTIEQAKGMLMVIYGIDEATAFELLKWRSQEANVKLRLLAEQIAADFVAVIQDPAVPTKRATFDNLLLTAHLRIPPDTGPEDEGGAA